MANTDESRWLPEEKLLVSLVPQIGPAIAQYLEDRQARRERQVGAMVVAGAEAAGMTADELLEQIISRPDLGVLFEAAAEAAMRATFEEKVRAIGRALVSGKLLQDDARLDTSLLIIRVVMTLNRSMSGCSG
jgi:hypothetical protein